MNSVTVEEVLVTEIRILDILHWNLQYIICPLEISIDITFLLNLKILNVIQGLKSFCESITNFIIWTTWNEYSFFTMSVSGIVIFCEVTEEYSDLNKLLYYIEVMSKKVDRDLVTETFNARNFILNRIKSITDDMHLIKRVDVIKRLPSLDVYLQMS